MSYQLVFWRQEDGETRPPQAIYDALADREVVKGLPELPVEDLLAGIAEAVPVAIRRPNGQGEWIEWTSPDQQSSFQIEWTPQCVWVTLRPLDEGRANQMIDIANAYGCALYDPQTSERFST